MNTVIPGTDIATTRIGFGTGSLHHVLSRSSRQRLLSVAFDEGIRHFDSAPLYGHGLAETELGIFGRLRRSNLVICSKVGLLANPFMERFPALMYMTKAILKAGIAKSLLQSPPRYIPLSGPEVVTAAEASLVRSLRALRTDYLDLLLLHEPPNDLALLPEELTNWFANVKKRGLVRNVGIAGESQVVARIASSSPVLAEVLQVSDSVQSCEADAVKSLGRDLQITYGYFRPSAERESSRNEGGAKEPISSLLCRAMTRNAHGVILFSSRSEGHVREICRVAQASRAGTP